MQSLKWTYGFLEGQALSVTHECVLKMQGKQGIHLSGDGKLLCTWTRIPILVERVHAIGAFVVKGQAINPQLICECKVTPSERNCFVIGTRNFRPFLTFADFVEAFSALYFVCKSLYFAASLWWPSCVSLRTWGEVWMLTTVIRRGMHFTQLTRA